MRQNMRKHIFLSLIILASNAFPKIGIGWWSGDNKLLVEYLNTHNIAMGIAANYDIYEQPYFYDQSATHYYAVKTSLYVNKQFAYFQSNSTSFIFSPLIAINNDLSLTRYEYFSDNNRSVDDSVSIRLGFRPEARFFNKLSFFFFAGIDVGINSIDLHDFHNNAFFSRTIIPNRGLMDISLIYWFGK
jgi:hypothetical protein